MLVPDRDMLVEHFGRLDFILIVMERYWRILSSGKICLHLHFRKIVPWKRYL